MPPVARSHHYVPEFYLAGFTPSGSRDDFLFVHDQKEERGWRQRPREIACEKDYYRVDIAGVAPDVIEATLAKFETDASEALRRIRTDRRLAPGEDFDMLLNFIALQATRSPLFRGIFERNRAHLHTSLLRTALTSEKRFDDVIASLRAEGKEVPESATREGLLEFLDDERRYTVEIPREATIKNMVEMAESLLPVLAERNWSLLVATDEETDFICSDSPVSLIATSPDAPSFLGFRLRCTEVLVPLDRRLAVVGHYDHPGSVINADRILVGWFNERSRHCAERFLYSPHEAFVVSVPRETEASATAEQQAGARIETP